MIRAGHAAVALVCGCLVWGLAGSGRLGSTAAWGGEVSYRGKTVSIIINSTAGGGTDMTARMVGGLMTKYLPGQPQIVFRNMPGGGGVKAGNYFASQVAPDGLTVLAGSRSQISPAKLRQPQVKYDPGKYAYIGGDAYLGTILLIRKEALPRLSDPAAKPVVFGEIDGTRSGLTLSLWAKEYLGWNLRWVIGYSGTPAMFLAIQSGEVDMIANQWNTAQVAPMLAADSDFAAVAQLGVPDEGGKMARQASLPDVPLISDLIVPKLDAATRASYERLMADYQVNKWLALPPNTPAEHVKAYRTAYQKIMRDPKFRQMALNEVGENFTPLTGEQIGRVVATLMATTDEDLALLQKLAEKNGLPSAR
jgi:tripartite-type tricarboxylate transporter receptor subunit TctC